MADTALKWGSLSALVVCIALFFSMELFSEHQKVAFSYLPDSLKPYFGQDTGPGSSTGSAKNDAEPYDVILEDTTVLLMTKEELAEYNGADGSKGLYLGILGRVYDVEKGKDHYGPGKGYGFFSGRDGTRAFVTGDFTERGLKDNVDNFIGEQMLEIENWIKFYDKSYTFVGKVVGNFYDQEGRPTQALRDAQQAIYVGFQQKIKTQEDKKKFPGCNSQTSKNSATRVWCTVKSGGIKREEAGVPRQYFRPGHPKPRCACIRTTGPPTDDPDSDANRGDMDNPLFKVYPDCEPLSESCNINID